MNRILEARFLAPDVKYFRVSAPRIAAKQRPGQFVVVRVTGDGERIPLTIADADADGGWISLIVQGLGKTTRTLNLREAGDAIHDLAGPLGVPSRIDRYGTVVVVGGGVGTAIVSPIATALAEAGNEVVAVLGWRSREYVILEDQMRAVCTEVYPTTDDGSYGLHGFVTDQLSELLARGFRFDRAFAAGPVVMMRAVAELTRPHAIDTVVSLNPLMIDGTGMCGGCRVSVGGETRFACVHGPEFDAHLVDFHLLERRNATYDAFEHFRNKEFHAELQGGLVHRSGGG